MLNQRARFEALNVDFFEGFYVHVLTAFAQKPRSSSEDSAE